jgi:signal peptidase II
MNDGTGSLRWLWLAGLVIVLDQGSKAVAVQMLTLHEPVAVMPSFNFFLTYNTGAAFSFLRGAGDWTRWFFSVLALGVSAFIVVWLRRLPGRQRWLACALSLILGGAVGNLVDRLFRESGGVVDFIDVFYGTWHWPAFNLADSAISIGAVMLLVSALRGEGKG